MRHTILSFAVKFRSNRRFQHLPIPINSIGRSNGLRVNRVPAKDMAGGEGEYLHSFLPLLWLLQSGNAEGAKESEKYPGFPLDSKPDFRYLITDNTCALQSLRFSACNVATKLLE